MTKLLEAKLYFLGTDDKDRGEVKLLRSLVHEDTVLFDVGGNIGQIALVVAKKATGGSVHVFEPAAENYSILQANIKANALTNVVPHQYAVSRTDGELTIHIPRNYNTGAISAYPDSTWDADVETVKAIRLDSYIEQAHLNRVDMIKIDVEGAELDVLEGSRHILENYRPYVFMEVTQYILERANRTPRDIINFWTDLHYEIFRIGSHGKLIPIANSEQFIDDQNLFCRPAELSHDISAMTSGSTHR